MPWAGTNTPALFLCFILFVIVLANFSELRMGEVRRIPLPRTPVNKGYTARSMSRRLFTSAPIALWYLLQGERR